jgi:hypothetical protein
MTNDDGLVEVVQDEEAVEVEPVPPEWIGDPGVQVIIIPRRRVVTNNRGTFLIVIVIYNLRAHLRLAFSIRAGVTRQDA